MTNIERTHVAHIAWLESQPQTPESLSILRMARRSLERYREDPKGWSKKKITLPTTVTITRTRKK